LVHCTMHGSLQATATTASQGDTTSTVIHQASREEMRVCVCVCGGGDCSLGGLFGVGPATEAAAHTGLRWFRGAASKAAAAIAAATASSSAAVGRV
jgi:hypothetical protein